MQEPYRKGVAIHPDPESCAGGGNIAGEALTGAHTGQPTQRVPGSVPYDTPFPSRGSKARCLSPFSANRRRMTSHVAKRGTGTELIFGSPRNLAGSARSQSPFLRLPLSA